MLGLHTAEAANSMLGNRAVTFRERNRHRQPANEVSLYGKTTVAYEQGVAAAYVALQVQHSWLVAQRSINGVQPGEAIDHHVCYQHLQAMLENLSLTQHWPDGGQ